MIWTMPLIVLPLCVWYVELKYFCCFRWLFHTSCGMLCAYNRRKEVRLMSATPKKNLAVQLCPASFDEAGLFYFTYSKQVARRYEVEQLNN